MKYYIADTHFGHRNVLTFDNRPFSDVDEMDRGISPIIMSTLRNGICHVCVDENT